MKYEVVVFGVKQKTIELLEFFAECNVRVDLVVTICQDSLSKNHISGVGDIRQYCKEKGLDFYAAKKYNLNAPDDLDFFETNSFELGLSCGWQRIIPSNVLNSFNLGIFGFHGSYLKLPGGKGRSPINWSIINGANKIYHNCFQYVEAVDDGKIYNTSTIPIDPFDDISSLEIKTLRDTKETFRRLVTDWKNKTINLVEQDGDDETFFSKRTPEDGKIDFSQSTRKIYDLIRAVTSPFPGAFCYSENEQRVDIWKAVPFNYGYKTHQQARVGEVVDILYNQLIIRTADGFLRATNWVAEMKPKIGTILY